MKLKNSQEVTKKPLPPSPFFDKIFARIPAETAATFTEAQLDAIKLAVSGRSWGSHTVDIQLSLPFPRNRYYLRVVTGRERRSYSRLLTKKIYYSLWTTANAFALAIVIVTLFLLLLTSSFGLLYLTKRAARINVFSGLDGLPDEKIEKFLDQHLGI